MHLSWFVIAAMSNQVSNSSNSSGNNSIVTISYITGSIAAIAGILGGLHRYYVKQRQRWIEDGESRAKGAQLLEQQSRDIADLTRKFDEFASSMRHELTELNTRISHLEERRRTER